MKYILAFLMVLLFSAPSVFAAPASLSFEPVAVNTSKGKLIDVTVNIFTGSQSVTSTDVWINYDPAIIQPVLDTVKTGSLFDTIEFKIIEPGKLYIYGIQKNPRQVDPVQGTLATIQFTALTEGTSFLSFDCDPSQKLSSQIIASDSNLSNVIHCDVTKAHSASVTVSGSSILGVSTENTIVTQISYVVGVIVLVFSLVLFIRYQHIRHEIS
jgi:hypothetical protein